MTTKVRANRLAIQLHFALIDEYRYKNGGRPDLAAKMAAQANSLFRQLQKLTS